MRSACVALVGKFLLFSLVVCCGSLTTSAESKCENDDISLMQMTLRDLQIANSKEMVSTSRTRNLHEDSGRIWPQAGAKIQFPLLFFGTHHKSDTAFARKLGEAMMKVVFDRSWGPLLVRGADGNDTWTSGELKQFEQEFCPPRPTLGILQNIDMPTLKRLDEGCGHFRMVHFVSDPVALTVSAYLDQSRITHDTAGPVTLNRATPYERVTSSRKAPDLYKKLSLKDGLKMQADLELNTSLRMMLAVNNATFWRTNVLTVALESFKTDFDEATRRVFDFFLGDRLPTEKLDLLQRHVHEIGVNTTKVGLDGHEHITSKEAIARAFDEWSAHHDEETFRHVQALRDFLAYDDDGQPCWSGSVSLSQIPGMLHQSWKDSTVPKYLSGYAETWRKIHPTWKYMFWDDQDNARLWEAETPHMLTLYRSFSQGVRRADATRLLYMLRFGGVYADFDVEPCQNLDSILNQWQAVFVKSPSGFVSNYFIASVPDHPFWKFALHQLLYVDQRLAEVKSESEKENMWFPGRFPFLSGHETMWTAGPKFLDEAFKKFAQMSSHRVMSKIKVYDFSEFQAEVGVHHWTGTWHCPGGGDNCTAEEKLTAAPTDGVEHGVNTSKTCSAVFQQK